MDLTHFVVLHCVSAGLGGPDLGSDESEIVLLIYVVVDVQNKKVVGVHRYPVRPTFIDKSNGVPNGGDADENENDVGRLSDLIRDKYDLSEETLKSAPTLEAVINQFDRQVASKLPRFRFVTDGQLHVRQCLFPEAQRANLALPSYYYQFHDLRKEFAAAYPESGTAAGPLDMIKALGLPEPEEDSEEIKQLESILLKLICDGKTFHEPDWVQTKLEQGIRSKDDAVDTNCCVKARGLPWQASDQDIAKFFIGLNVAKGGVALCLSSQGRRNGEALVLFESVSHRDMALNRHKHHIGNRYIEVYKATGEDFINVAGGNNKEAQAFLSRGGQVIIRMRGLPYDASAKQVTDFFVNGNNSCNVLDNTEGVLFVRRPDGRATGDAFVLFAEEVDAEKALQKHKESIGSRYIELFRSTTAEVQRVLNRTMEGNSKPTNRQLQGNSAMGQIPLISQVPTSHVIPQQMITAGTKKDCIRLRGLPYEAQVEHILEFLGDHAKSIVYQGVHMVYNAQGQPSGEAFIQMSSEQAAYQASQNRHNRYMGFGKKQRYIEVFQCSGEDMNLVLTGTNSTNNLANLAVAAVAAGGASGLAQQSQQSTGKAMIPPGGALFHHGFDPFNIHLNGNLAIASMNGNSRNFPPGPFAAGNTQNPQLLYWHYPSPPISPNNYFGGMQTNGIHLQALNGHLSPSVHSFQHQLLTAASYNVIKANGQPVHGANNDNPKPSSPTSDVSSLSTAESYHGSPSKAMSNVGPAKGKDKKDVNKNSIVTSDHPET